MVLRRSGNKTFSVIHTLGSFLYSLNQYRDAKACAEGAIRPAIGGLALNL